MIKTVTRKENLLSYNKIDQKRRSGQPIKVMIRSTKQSKRVIEFLCATSIVFDGRILNDTIYIGFITRFIYGNKKHFKIISKEEI